MVAVRVDDVALIRGAQGLALGYLPEEKLKAAVNSGRLVRVLAVWCRLGPAILSVSQPPQPSPSLYWSIRSGTANKGHQSRRRLLAMN
jgi:hypothetical protein